MKPTIILALAAMGCLMACTPQHAFAQEHEHGGNLPDWYDPACCNQRDCKPVKDEDIEFDILPGGGLIARHKPTGNIFLRNQFKPSQDERYHICIYNGTSLCFYDRTGV